MKDIYEIMQQKHSELRRVQTEIEALHTVIPLLVDHTDWLEHGVIVGPMAAQNLLSGLSPKMVSGSAQIPQKCGLR